jgi:hypothetical protein
VSKRHGDDEQRRRRPGPAGNAARRAIRIGS